MCLSALNHPLVSVLQLLMGKYTTPESQTLLDRAELSSKPREFRIWDEIGYYYPVGARVSCTSPT